MDKEYHRQKSRAHYQKHKAIYISRNEQRMINRREMKKRLVKMLGGKCHRCGYSKCINALEFHHNDAKEKTFSIGRKITLSFEKLWEEVQKCTLLCANCHRELEFETKWGPMVQRENASLAR